MASPYYRFGYQSADYAYNWHGGPGGVPQASTAGRAAETRELGDFDLEESGATPYAIHYPAVSDWPALRPSGPEPLDPGETGLGLFGSLSDNEKRLAVLGVGAFTAWWFILRKQHKRRRKSRRRR